MALIVPDGYDVAVLTKDTTKIERIADVASHIAIIRDDLSDAEVRRTMDRVFRAQVRDQLAWTDSLAGECRGEPMFHLMRARLIRELLPVDDEGNQDLKREAEPLYSELETTIAYCDERIKAGDKDDRLHLYRGWAWMLKSHVHTFERSFWSAGRESKKGNRTITWWCCRNVGIPSWDVSREAAFTDPR